MPHPGGPRFSRPRRVRGIRVQICHSGRRPRRRGVSMPHHLSLLCIPLCRRAADCAAARKAQPTREWPRGARCGRDSRRKRGASEVLGVAEFKANAPIHGTERRVDGTPVVLPVIYEHTVNRSRPHLFCGAAAVVVQHQERKRDGGRWALPRLGARGAFAGSVDCTGQRRGTHSG